MTNLPLKISFCVWTVHDHPSHLKRDVICERLLSVNGKYVIDVNSYEEWATKLSRRGNWVRTDVDSTESNQIILQFLKAIS